MAPKKPVEGHSRGLIADGDDLGDLVMSPDGSRANYRAGGPFQAYTNILQSASFYVGEAQRFFEQGNSSAGRVAIEKARDHTHTAEKMYRDQVRRFEHIGQEAQDLNKRLHSDIEYLNKESKSARERVLEMEHYWSVWDFIVFKYTEWRKECAKRKRHKSQTVARS